MEPAANEIIHEVSERPNIRMQAFRNAVAAISPTLAGEALRQEIARYIESTLSDAELVRWRTNGGPNAPLGSQLEGLPNRNGQVRGETIWQTMDRALARFETGATVAQVALAVRQLRTICRQAE